MDMAKKNANLTVQNRNVQLFNSMQKHLNVCALNIWKLLLVTKKLIQNTNALQKMLLKLQRISQRKVIAL